MRTLTFHGESDDLFEIEGTTGDEPDEIGPGTVRLVAPDGGGLCVTAAYSPAKNGCWMVGISQLDEDLPLPDWPMRWVAPAGRGYSVALEVDVPNGVVVEAVS